MSNELNIVHSYKEEIIMDHTQENDITLDSKLKEMIIYVDDFIKTRVMDKDYTVKFNNNNLNKITINNKISDLIQNNKTELDKHSIEIKATPEDTFNKKDEDNLKSFLENDKKRNDIEKQNRLDRINFCKTINFDKLEKHLKSLIDSSILDINYFGKDKNIENKKDNIDKEETKVEDSDKKTYFCKIISKLIERFTTYDEMFENEGKSETVKNNNDQAQNMDTLKLSDSINYYNKVITLATKKIYEFIYPYGNLFLSSKAELRTLTKIINGIIKTLVEHMNTRIIKALDEEEKLKKKPKTSKEFFTKLYASIINLRSYLYSEENVPLPTFYSFDEPVEVNFSENTYLQVKDLIRELPNEATAKTSLEFKSEAEYLNEISFIILERDIRIYNYYGVKMTEFLYGFLLYDN